MGFTSANRNLSGKVYDPVFLCMLGAVILAVASSIALRTMVGGPASAHASAGDSVDDVPHRVPARTAPIQPPQK